MTYFFGGASRSEYVKKLFVANLVIILLCCFALVAQEVWRRGRIPKSDFSQAFFLPLEALSNFQTDLKFRLRGPVKPRQKIVIVAIDNPSIEAIGRWPWPRNLLAELVESIFQAGAKTVALDIILSEPQRIVPEEMAAWLKEKKLSDEVRQWETDPKLALVMELRADQLVPGWQTEAPCRPAQENVTDCPVGEAFSLKDIPAEMASYAFSGVNLSPHFDFRRTTIPSAPEVTALAAPFLPVVRHSGFVNAFPDGDGKIRRVGLVMMVAGKPLPSLALETSRLFRGSEVEVSLGASHSLESLKFRDTNTRITEASTGVVGINFRGPEGTFPHLSAFDLFGYGKTEEESRERAARARRLLDGAVALVGMTALAFPDFAVTPFDFAMPGAEVHANVIDNLLSGDLLHYASPVRQIAFLLALMLVGGGCLSFIGQRWSPRRAFLSFLGIGVVLLALDFLVGPRFSLMMNTGLVYMQFAGIFCSTLGVRYVQEIRQRQFLRTAFSKYLSPAVVDLIVKNPSLLALGGKKETLTVLFCDIRDFTIFSETVDAKLLSEFLNDYLTEATRIVFKHGGTVDKYIGDAIMAFWGAPVSMKDHALKGYLAAQEMILRVEQRREHYLKKYGINLRIGVGVNTGPMSVGNMGSESALSYTIIGDHVNLGSRLEGATKNFGVAGIISIHTLNAIRESGYEDPPVRPLGAVEVKGRKASVEVFEILPASENQVGTAKNAA